MSKANGEMSKANGEMTKTKGGVDKLEREANLFYNCNE